MGIPAGLKLRFHYLTTALLAVFVVSLMGVFLFAAWNRFDEMAEESATGIFAHIADHNAARLQEMIASASRLVRIQASVEAVKLHRDGRLDTALVAPALLVAVRENPNLYGVYLGLDNDDFVQAIGVRGDPAVTQALAAPADTWFALRTILADTDGRTEHWRFLDRDGVQLAELQRPAEYRPGTRPWYQSARSQAGLQATDPYHFQSSQALGLTLSQALEGGGGVVGADLALGELQRLLADTVGGREGGAAVIDSQRRVLAFHASAGLAAPAPAPLQPLGEALTPLLQPLSAGGVADGGGGGKGSRLVDLQGERYAYALREVALTPGKSFQVAAFAPISAFSGPIVRTRDDIMLISALVLALALPASFFASRQASRALGLLAADSERVKRLDFSGRVTVRSMFYEIDTLGEAHQTMKVSLLQRTRALNEALAKLQGLVENGLLLSSERDRETLLRHVLEGGRQLCNARVARLYLANGQDGLRLALDSHGAAAGDGVEEGARIALRDASGAPRLRDPLVLAALERCTVTVADVTADPRFDADVPAGAGASLLTVPMTASSGEVIGVLQFIDAVDPDSGATVPFGPETVQYIEALASQSAVALDNQQLLNAQQVLMDSLIQIIASAIDAKSAYTGGHCARVPELAMMLAEEACKADHGPLADFRFETEDEWREFRVGAWLHDCGKVTTPEFVMDKATKLETIYNRIHEIRTRFEVLLRDAEIERLHAERNGMEPAQAAATFAGRIQQLQADFAFVAACNIGGESIADEDVQRLRRIGGQTWLRHFDDRLGLSHGELRRLADLPAAELPAVERLLADKPEHVVPRTGGEPLDPRFGFRIAVPEHLYDFGELHNLAVSRGTLTEEERFKINEHIIQTVVMLDRLPLPAHLKRVPEYAATHHETLVGTGYPRRLEAGQLSVPARIMAVADIFEALTAPDRPYKKAKTLSEAIHILDGFKRRQHIDADVFDLFLRSGVYLRYAERFLAPEQIDEVDLAAYLG